MKQLVGKWISDPADSEATSKYGYTSLEFLSDGGLVYTIQSHGKQQIMLLTYRIEGDHLVTDQSSRPSEERTRFQIEPCGKLTLFYERTSSTYIRVTDQ
jgi:hypothetical protein